MTAGDEGNSGGDGGGKHPKQWRCCFANGDDDEIQLVVGMVVMSNR